VSVGDLTNRVRQNYTRGVLSAQISAAVTTVTSTDFTTIPEVLQGDQFALMSLDPDQVNGAPELVKVTEHAAGSDTVIVERHAEGTVARIHPVSTVWRLVSTADDFWLIENLVSDGFEELDLALTGYLPLAGGTLGGDLALGGNDIDMAGGQVRNLLAPVDGTAAVSQDHGDSRYLRLIGGTMTGALNMGAQRITNLGAPTVDTDAATRGYVLTSAAPLVHTHAAGDVTSGTFDAARIPGLDGAKITTGTINGNRIPDLGAGKITTGTFDPDRIPNLSANKITQDTLGLGRIPNLPASQVTSGTFAAARIPSSFVQTGDIPTFSGLKFDELIPYHGASNGSLRWIGVDAEIAQSHTSSSLDYKTDVEDVDLAKSVFSRLDPIHFQYREDHPFRYRWRDWDAEARRATGRMGVAYEQVAEVVPEWTYEADEMACVAYEAMLPDLVADYLALRKLVLDRLGI
jgi:hypothetical protein